MKGFVIYFFTVTLYYNKHWEDCCYGELHAVSEREKEKKRLICFLLCGTDLDCEMGLIQGYGCSRVWC